MKVFLQPSRQPIKKQLPRWVGRREWAASGSSISWSDLLLHGFLSILIILLVSVGTKAENSPEPGVFHGQVVDAATMSPLAGAYILLVDQGIRTYTDDSGRFTLSSIPWGSHSIRISHIGYRTLVERLDYHLGGIHYQLFRMTMEPEKIADVTIKVPSLGQRSSYILTGEELRHSTASDVADVISFIPGVQVHASDYLGKKTIAIRGSRPDQVMIMLDDVLLNDGSGTAVNLAEIPLETISSIEIDPDNSSEGRGGVGGLVHIRTRSTVMDGNLHRVEFSGETIGGRGYSFSLYGNLSGKTGILSYSGKISSDEGNFSYSDEYNKRQARLNNWKKAESLYFRLTPSTKHLHGFSLIGFTSNMTGGTPSPLFRPATPGAGQEDRTVRIILNAGNEQTDGTPGSLTVHFQVRERKSTNPEIQFNPIVGEYVHFVPYDYREKTRDTGFRYRFLRTSREDGRGEWRLAMAVGGGATVYSNRNLEPDGTVNDQLAGKVHRSSTWSSLRLERRQQLGKYKLTAIGSGSVNGYEEKLNRLAFPSEFRPSGSISLALRKLAEKERYSWELRTSLNRIFTLPSYSSLFLMENVFARGNPSLKPEEALQFSFGSVAEIRSEGNGVHLNLSLVYFRKQTDNLIIWRSNSRGQFFPANAENTMARGIESALSSAFFDRKILLDLSLTSQKVTNTNPHSFYYGKRIPFQPDWFGSARLTFSCAPFDMGFESRFSGRRFTSESNLDLLNASGSGMEPYHVENMFLNLALKMNSPGMMLSIRVLNLFDRDYELLNNYPMPGRMLILSMKVDL